MRWQIPPSQFFLAVVCALTWAAPLASGQTKQKTAAAKPTAAKAVPVPDPLLRWASRESAETGVALEGNQALEALTVTVQLPAVASGKVSQANAKNARLKPATQEAWRPLLLPGRHYFLEVSGPQGHAWCGHRLEIDEAQTLRGDTRTVVWEISPRNTRAPHASLAGANVLVRPHVTLPMLFARSWDSLFQSQPGLGPITGTLSRPEGGTEDFQVSRGSAPGNPIWQLQGRVAGEAQLILPPGSGLVVRLPGATGLGVGLRGETRNFPCRVPLAAGWNLVGYPFPQDLRLGRDWGVGDTTASAGSDPTQCDRIVAVLDGQTKEYALWASPAGPRWRRTQPGGAQWQNATETLDTLPTGFAFYLFRQKANPHHVFLPPAP